MDECELLQRCGFFAKYRESRDLACRGFMNSFCRGPKYPTCARLKYRTQHGCAPDDDLLPTGQMMPKSMGGHG